jgi:O-antigen/teichoic acid export membrane protein
MQRGDEHKGGRILANSAVMTAGQIVVVAIGFILTPVIIANVGIAMFGAWGIFTTAAGYITILDPGTSGIVTRFGAMAHVRGDKKEMARLTSLGFASWALLGLLVTPVMLVVIPLLASHIHVAGTSTHELSVFFWWGYALVIFTAMQAVLSGQLTAIGLLWVTTVIDVSCRLFYGVVLVVGFVAHMGLWALIVASFAQGIAVMASTFIISWRTYGFPIGNPAKLDRAVFREVRRFGGWAQVTSVLNTLTYSTDPIVIGTFVSAGAAGVANLGSRLARQIPYFATVPEATLPAMSAAQQAGEGPEGIARMSIRSNRISYLLGAGVASIIVGAAPVILALWQGRSYSEADLATCIVAGSMLASMLGQTAGIGIYAMGKVGYGVRARFAGFIVNLVATIALAIPFGMPGVLLGTLLATLTTNGYLQIRVNQLLDLNGWTSVWQWMLPLIAATAPAIVSDRLLIAFMPASVQHHRLPALIAFGALLVVNYLVLLVGLRAWRYLGDQDVAFLRRSLPGPVRKVLSPRVVSLIVRPAKVGS